MNEKQKSEIVRMRKSGTSYSKISQITGISKNTIKSFCRRNNVLVDADSDNDGKEGLYCKYCKKMLKKISGRKIPKFCSKECRTKWWNSHPEAVNRKAVYTFTCAGCKRIFTAYGNKGRKYCSHGCYINARFKVDKDDE